MLPWLEEKRTGSPHFYVASEWHTESGVTVSPGRMIRTSDFKYTHYLEDGGEELYDMINDPGETKTLVNEEHYKKELFEHRKLFRKHLKETGDGYFNLQCKVSNKCRNHKLGYENHEGLCAPK